ncbi:MAG: hypothetical protein OCU12_07220 [Methanophagales archaeon]|nr:hypothetical protein [Methanophagales archaeon]
MVHDKNKDQRRGHQPQTTLPRGPASRLRRAIPIGSRTERPGDLIEFDVRDPDAVVFGRVLAVWNDGVTLRRSDTGTIQFLYRGDYELLDDEMPADLPVDTR